MNDELDAQAAELLSAVETVPVLIIEEDVCEVDHVAESGFTYNILPNAIYLAGPVDHGTQWFPIGSEITLVSDEPFRTDESHDSVNMRGITSNMNTREYLLSVDTIHENTPKIKTKLKADALRKAELKKLAHEALVKDIRDRKKITDQSIIPQVKEALEAIYPGNWDIQECLDDAANTPYFTYDVIILFPEVTLTNGVRGVSYKIKDLYVKLEYNEDFVLKNSMQGRRGILSVTDHSCGYRHSHLPSSTMGWANFCLGASELSAITTDLSSPREIQGDFSIIQFELHMYQIDAYVKWESLGGGPHFRIRNIRITGETRHILESRKSNIYTEILRKIDNFPVKFDNTNKRFVIDFLELEDFLTKRIVDFGNLGLSDNVMCKKAGDSYIYSTSYDLNFLRDKIIKANRKLEEDAVQYTFKGEKKRVVVEELDVTEDMEKNLEDVMHPDITRYVLRELESFINYHFIKNYGK